MTASTQMFNRSSICCSLRNPGKDSQGGFNLHLMALNIPIAELGGDQQIVGVYATTSRQKVTVLRDDDRGGSRKE